MEKGVRRIMKEFTLKEIILFALLKRSNFIFLDNILDEIKNRK